MRNVYQKLISKVLPTLIIGASFILPVQADADNKFLKMLKDVYSTQYMPPQLYAAVYALGDNLGDNDGNPSVAEVIDTFKGLNLATSDAADFYGDKNGRTSPEEGNALMRRPQSRYLVDLFRKESALRALDESFNFQPEGTSDGEKYTNHVAYAAFRMTSVLAGDKKYDPAVSYKTRITPQERKEALEDVVYALGTFADIYVGDKNGEGSSEEVKKLLHLKANYAPNSEHPVIRALTSQCKLYEVSLE